MTTQPTPTTTEADRLAELCDRLMALPSDQAPCSHNLLAQMRDEARSGVYSDDCASHLRGLLERKMEDK